ncbi:MAG: beta-aspartyl-peptidase [Spirochaetes bacterium]|nr:beta-aspartyl-peptidase [Spirochaetota bacterium]
MIFIQQATVYSPSPRGKMDLLIGGGKILAMEKRIDPSGIPGITQRIDASGMILIPGFIDGHQHFTGGGGEGGFQTRVPELTVSMNFRNGVTTAVGLLGTDSLTRSIENLYAKTQAFNAEGLTAFMLTGSYWHPSPTLTGSVARDIVFLQPVIGLKLALADSRGPHLEAKDLASLASDVQVAGLVANKPGIITVHTGVKSQTLDLIFEIIERFEIRPSIFVPTHVNRKSEKLTTQAFMLAEKGCVVDATCHAEVSSSTASWINAAEFACKAKDNGLLEQVSFSSDAGGSMPIWNQDRSRIIGMGVGTPSSLLFELELLVNKKGFPLEQALLPLTTTPARIYRLDQRKGMVEVGKDADLILLDPSSFTIRDVLSNGEWVVKNGIVEKKGYFEHD